MLLAWLNKTAHYYEYRRKKGHRSTWTKFWADVTEWYVVDFVADLASLSLVGVALFVMVKNVLNGPC